MSIVHRALKKAEGEEQKKERQENGTTFFKHTADKERSYKRLLTIFAIFFALLIFVLFFPLYYKKMKMVATKESITAMTTGLSELVRTDLTESEKQKATTDIKKERQGSSDAFDEESLEQLNIKGIYYYKNKDYDMAYRYFSEALKKDTSNYETHNNLGITLKWQGKYEKALRHYKTALSLKERYKEGYNNIGVLYDNMGQYSKAVDAFNKAIRLDKNYEDPYFNIALTYEKMKKYKSSRKHYVQYLNFYKDDDSAFISSIKKRVELLKKVP